jgi:hypothetical protein
VKLIDILTNTVVKVLPFYTCTEELGESGMLTRNVGRERQSRGERRETLRFN